MNVKQGLVLQERSPNGILSLLFMNIPMIQVQQNQSYSTRIGKIVLVPKEQRPRIANDHLVPKVCLPLCSCFPTISSCFTSKY